VVNWRKFWRRWGIALSLREPPILPTYAWSYFDHMAAVYVTLNTADPRADEVIRKATEKPDNLTWGDIFLLEDVIFTLQPPEVVNRNAWIIRERFREIAGSTVYEKYIASSIPTDTDTPEKMSLLKADLTRILDVLHWHYSLIPMRERMRKSLTKYCVLYVTAYTALAGVLLHAFHLYGNDFAAVLTCVVYWGIIGGFVSSQRRMERLPSDGDPLIGVFGLDSADYYLWLSPMLGGIFAVILMLMFVAGILKGTVFPDFIIPARKEGLSYFEFAWRTLPRASDDYAKLFVWAFLAGFAERLVPDSLDRLSSKLNASDKPSGPKSPAVSPKTPGSDPKAAVINFNGPQPQAGADVAASERGISPATLTNVLHTGEVPPPENLQSETEKQKC
jgi:hypothetical protein